MYISNQDIVVLNDHYLLSWLLQFSECYCGIVVVDQSHWGEGGGKHPATFGGVMATSMF